MDQKTQSKKYMQVIAKCWSDQAFKAKLMKDPVKILKENGVEMPADMKLHVVENTEKECYLIIPPKPSTELSDDQLDKVAGGGTWGTIGSACIATAGTAYCHG